MPETISVEVVYAKPERQWLIETKVLPKSPIEIAIQNSGILELCPEVELSKVVTGIFGKVRPLDHPLQEGDRVEIYRALLKDPRDARRERHKGSTTSPHRRHQSPQTDC